MSEDDFLIQKKLAHNHYVVAFIGGFLGLFPIIYGAKIFGSSQTVNLMETVVGALKMDWQNVGLHLAGCVLYCLAVFLVTFLPCHTKINVKICSMVVDVGAAFLMWKMPENLPLTVYLFPTFFSMAFQWCAFSGAYGFVSSTIFSTNNLRQAVSALTEVLFNKKKEFALKAKFFGLVLLYFHIGVAVSFLLNKKFGNASFLFVLIPAIFVVVRQFSFVKKADD